MEHIVNQIILTGNLAGAPRYSHENHGRPPSGRGRGWCR